MDNMKETIEELWLEYRSHTNSEDAWQFKEWLIKQQEPILLNTKEFGLPDIGTKEFNDLASAYFGGKPK